MCRQVQCREPKTEQQKVQLYNYDDPLCILFYSMVGWYQAESSSMLEATGLRIQGEILTHGFPGPVLVFRPWYMDSVTIYLNFVFLKKIILTHLDLDNVLIQSQSLPMIHDTEILKFCLSQEEIITFIKLIWSFLNCPAFFRDFMKSKSTSMKILTRNNLKCHESATPMLRKVRLKRSWTPICQR